MSVALMAWAAGHFEALELSANNVSAFDAGPALCGNPGATGSPGLTISNGSGSYSFAWTQVGTPADAGPYTCQSPTDQNPTWTGSETCDGDDNSEDWKCVVTDTVLGVVADITISVTRTWVQQV